MPDINIKADVKKTSTLGKVRILVEQVVGSPSQAQINTAVASYIDSHPGALSPLSAATKSALLQIAQKVAYIDENGQDYYDALDAALNAKALLSITAVYTQSGTVYDTDSLDSLKSDLVVTAYYDDATSADVTSASTLSGTLAVGTSTVTVTFNDKTASFEVTVTKAVTQYTITNNLTDCVNSNSATKINENTQYSGTLTPSSGYRMSSVSVTMGGTDITGTAYNSSDGSITIASVTGNVVITATAVEDVPVSGTDAWYDGVNYAFTEGVIKDTYISNNGVQTAYTGWDSSDFMNCEGAATIEAYNVRSDYGAFYDANKTYIQHLNCYGTQASGWKKTVTVPSNAKYFRTSWARPETSSSSHLGDGAYIKPHAE